jgi:hypothetical protein
MTADRLLQFGWKPHTSESRKAMKFAKPMTVPKRATRRPRKFSLYYLCVLLDQLALGSCTAQAAAQVIRMACVAAGITDPVLISRLCAYYLARVRAGEQGIDAGSQVGTIFDVLADGGCFPEWAWAYDITRFAEMPDTRALQMGHDSRATIGLDYSEVTGRGDDLIENVLDTVADIHGVAFGSMVNTDYADGPTGIIHVNPKATVVGGHAQTIIGYDEDEEYVEVIGSWEMFGESGQVPGVARFGFDYVKAEFSDLWIVNKVPNIPVQP